MMNQKTHSDIEKNEAAWIKKIASLKNAEKFLCDTEMLLERMEDLEQQITKLYRILVKISPDGEIALKLYKDLIQEEENRFNPIEAYHYVEAMSKEFPYDARELSIRYRKDIVHKDSTESDLLLSAVFDELNARYSHPLDNRILIDYQIACSERYGIYRKYVDLFIQLACQEVQQGSNKKSEQDVN